MDYLANLFVSAAVAVGGFLGVANLPEQPSEPIPEVVSTTPTSVEIGLAEYSPMGEGGGAAIPASACGNPHTGGHTSGCVPTPTVCNSPSGLCCWVNGTGSCNSVCQASSASNNYAINPTPNGGQCLSGESRPSQALTALGSGNPPFAYGCWPSGTCSVANAASSNANTGNYCYSPGQVQDSDPTDRVVACFCEVTALAHCSAPPAPTVNVVARVTTSGGVTTTYTTDTNIRWDDTVQIRWNGFTFDAPSLNCTATAGFTYTGTTINGTSPAPTPAPGTAQPYRLRCTDNNGSDVDTITLTVPAPPNADIDIRKSTQSVWTTNTSVPFVIGPTEEVHLRWTTARADSCSAVILGTGSGFSTGGATAGNDLTIGEPPVGYYAIYRINCPGPGGNASDEVEVQRPAPTPILTVSDNLVDIGDQITLSWDTNFNTPSACTLRGPNLTYAIPTATGNYPSPITINGESDFTLDCAPNVISPTTGLPVNPGGSDAEKVSVTGRLIET